MTVNCLFSSYKNRSGFQLTHSKEKWNENFNGKAISLFLYATLGCENIYCASKYVLNYAKIDTELRKTTSFALLPTLVKSKILQKRHSIYDLKKVTSIDKCI